MRNQPCAIASLHDPYFPTRLLLSTPASVPLWSPTAGAVRLIRDWPSNPTRDALSVRRPLGGAVGIRWTRRRGF